jgi:hypothetical protein
MYLDYKVPVISILVEVTVTVMNNTTLSLTCAYDILLVTILTCLSAILSVFLVLSPLYLVTEQDRRNLSLSPATSY